MSLKQRYGSLLGFVFLIFTVSCPCLSQASHYKCMSSYVSARSIHFGILLKQAKTIEELEFLNKLSAENLQFSTDGDPESHMLNSLIFYRRAYELNFEFVLEKELYKYILNNSEKVLNTKPKFNFFKFYLNDL